MSEHLVILLVDLPPAVALDRASTMLGDDPARAGIGVSTLTGFSSAIAQPKTVGEPLSSTLIEVALPQRAASAFTVETRRRLSGLGPGARMVVVERRKHLDRRVPGHPVGPRFVAFVKRAAGLGLEEFWAYWRGRHVPLVLASDPGFERYFTARVVDAEASIDGVVDQWFLDEKHLVKHLRSIGGRLHVVEDATRFVGAAESYIARRWPATQ